MKPVVRRTNVMQIWVVILTVAVYSFLVTADAAQKKFDEREALTPAVRETAERAVPLPSDCGGMEFDRDTGRMVPRPNIDLVVKHLEIFTTERGTWVRPTIRNNCPGVITEDIHISIGRVVITYAGLPPQTDVPYGYAVGVPAAASYTAIVDYDRRIAETNNGNNRCTRSTTGNCP